MTARKVAPTLAEIKSSWPATVNVPDANRAGGWSDSHGYDLIGRGEYPFKVLRVGGRIRVLTASIIRVLEGA